MIPFYLVKRDTKHPYKYDTDLPYTALISLKGVNIGMKNCGVPCVKSPNLRGGQCNLSKKICKGHM